MTVETTTNSQSFSGSGTSPFNVNFKFLANTDLVVVRLNNTSGTLTTLVLNSDYTVTGAGDPGGGVVTPLASETGNTITVTRKLVRTQPTDFNDLGAFPAEDTERGLDRLTMMAQEALAATDRALVVPEGDTPTDTVLKTSAERASTILGFGTDGALKYYPVDTPIISLGQTVIMSQVPGWGTSSSAASNAAALGIALEEVRGNGGGEIIFDQAGQFTMNTVLKTGIDNLKLTATKGVELYGPNVDYANDRGLLELFGAPKASSTATIAITAAATSITVADGSKFTAGDLITIDSNSEYWNGIAGVDGFEIVNKGEMNYVNNVVGNVLTLAWPVLESFSITGPTVTVTPYNTITDIQIDGLRFIGPEDQAVLANGSGSIGLKVYYFDRFTAKNLGGYGWQNAFADLWGINYNVSGGEIKGKKLSTPSANYYGWYSQRTYHGKIKDVTGSQMRKIADTGSGTNAISRYIEQSGLLGTDIEGSVAGSHHAQFIEVHSCRGRDCDTVVNTRAKDSYIHDNVGRSLTGTGIGVGAFYTSSTTVSANVGTTRIVDNDIETNSFTAIRVHNSHESAEVIGNRMVSAPATIYGVLHFAGQTRKKTKVHGNTIRGGGALTSTQNGIWFRNEFASVTQDDDIDVGVNTFINIGGALIKHDALTTGTAKRVHMARQSSDRLETRASMFAMAAATSYENKSLCIEFGTTGESAPVNRNLLDNAGFRIDNINAFAVLGTTSAANYICDRWRVHAGTQTINSRARVNTSSPPDEATHSFSVQTVLTPAAPGAAERYMLEQILEGNEIAHLKWGTANAKPIVVSVRVRANVFSGGSIALTVQNGAKDRSHVVPLAVGNAGAWTTLYAVIPGDTSGTWPTDNTAAMRFIIDLGSGSNYQTASPSTWQAADVTRTASTIELINQAQFNAYDFTLSVLAQGTQLLDFERRPHELDELICSRHWQKLPVWVQAAPSFTTVPIIMRATPTPSGGGAGFASTGTSARSLLCNQTSAALQTIILDANLT